MTTARRVAEFYAARGLLEDAGSRPLDTACVCGPDCWRGYPKAKVPPPEEAGISLPWVGRSYGSHRVVIVAINLVGFGGLWANWEIKDGELRGLSEGRKRINRSSFAYAIGSYAHAAIRGGEGRPLEDGDLPAPQQGADALEGCAFLQAVKCAPWWERSIPTETMTHNCPREYLLEELQLLEPAALMEDRDRRRGR